MPEETYPSKKISWLKVILTGVTISLVVVLIGEGLFWNFYVREPAESTPVTTTKQVTPSAKQATPSAEKDETVDGRECSKDSDCVVLGKTGDCNCGCFNKNYTAYTSGGQCFCMAPAACSCVKGKCVGK